MTLGGGVAGEQVEHVSLACENPALGRDSRRDHHCAPCLGVCRRDSPRPGRPALRSRRARRRGRRPPPSCGEGAVSPRPDLSERGRDDTSLTLMSFSPPVSGTPAARVRATKSSLRDTAHDTGEIGCQVTRRLRREAIPAVSSLVSIAGEVCASFWPLTGRWRRQLRKLQSSGGGHGADPGEPGPPVGANVVTAPCPIGAVRFVAAEPGSGASWPHHHGVRRLDGGRIDGSRTNGAVLPASERRGPRTPGGGRRVAAPPHRRRQAARGRACGGAVRRGAGKPPRKRRRSSHPSPRRRPVRFRIRVPDWQRHLRRSERTRIDLSDALLAHKRSQGPAQ